MASSLVSRVPFRFIYHSIKYYHLEIQLAKSAIDMSLIQLNFEA